MTGIVPPPPPVETASTSLPMSGRLVLPFSKSTKSLSMTGIVPPPPPVKTSLRPSTSNPKRLSSQIPENTIWSGKRRKSSGTPMPSTQATSSQDHSAPLPTVPLRPAEPLGPPPWLRELSLRLLVWGKQERSDPDGLLNVVHADDFHNPEGNMGLAKSHCGLHDVMMEGMCENPLFMVKAMRLIQALRSHMEDPHGSANVEIGVCCSRGRHRSVA